MKLIPITTNILLANGYKLFNPINIKLLSYYNDLFIFDIVPVKIKLLNNCKICMDIICKFNLFNLDRELQQYFLYVESPFVLSVLQTKYTVIIKK